MTTSDIDVIRKLAAAVDQHDTRAMPNGTERPGEHWNARLIREEAERKALARTLVPALCDEVEQLRESARYYSALVGERNAELAKLRAQLDAARGLADKFGDKLANVRRLCDDYKDQPPPIFRGPGLSERGEGYNAGTRDIARAVLSYLDGERAEVTP